MASLLVRRSFIDGADVGASAPDGAGGSAEAGGGLPPGLRVLAWAEVYCGSAELGQWVAVDPVRGLVNRPELMCGGPGGPSAGGAPSGDPAADYAADMAAAASRKAAAGVRVAYVVACPGGGRPLWDVTPRYATNMLAVRHARGPAEAWWADTLRKLQAQQPQAGAPAATQPSAGPPQAAAAHPKPPRARRQAGGPAPPPQSQSQPQPPPQQPHGSEGAAAERAQQEAMRVKREEAELSHKAATKLQGLPTSIEGFKTHPLYVLKRHINKYEALRPGAPLLGLHKGEPYFSRDDLSDLHTAERWRREGRNVREGELDKPAKQVPKRQQPGQGQGPQPGRGAAFGRHGRGAGAGMGTGARGGGRGPARGARRFFGGPNSAYDGGAAAAAAAAATEEADAAAAPEATSAAAAGRAARARAPAGPDADSAGGAEDADLDEEVDEAGASGAEMVSLYGLWQTEAWAPPAAQGGRVPRNERGNVECPPFAKALPQGCVHLDYPGLPTVCRSLDLDFAPALVGFERQGGRMVPKLQGVVVCEEHEQLVMSAFLEREAAKQKAAADRRAKEARALWLQLQLLQAMRVRVQLRSSYEEQEQQQAPPQEPQQQQQAEQQRKAAAEQAVRERLRQEHEEEEPVGAAQEMEGVEEF